MVGEGIAPLTATPEPDVKASLHPAPEQPGHYHWHYRRRLLNRFRLFDDYNTG
jgi:hypothetical protein